MGGFEGALLYRGIDNGDERNLYGCYRTIVIKNCRRMKKQSNQKWKTEAFDMFQFVLSFFRCFAGRAQYSCGWIVLFYISFL